MFSIVHCLHCNLRAPISGEVLSACPLCGGELVVVQEYSSYNLPPREGEMNKRKTEFSIILDNVRSAYNVGSIARSADAAGFGHIYIGGITPSLENKQVLKTALGAQGTIPWTSHKNTLDLVAELKQNEYLIWALEYTLTSQSLFSLNSADFTLEKICFVVGNEVCGVDPEILKLADKTLHIPMYGAKQSLNVANAATVGMVWVREIQK